jgi:hypothetical protein
MTTITCFYYKVNRFLIIIVSNTFDELLLHYDVCWLSFSEILTWIKKGALVAVDALHKIVTAIGGGVSVAKVQP